MINAIKKAIQFLDDSCFDSLNISYIKSEDPTLLNVVKEGKDVVITYGQPSSLFRGLTLVKEKAKEENFDVTYHRHFHNNGWMIDVSRNATFKKESVKKVILIMALFGMNQLMLYTEDTYEMKKYPYFGYLRGRYTKEDIQELVEYGNAFGVELVPCIETLDHLGRVMRWDAFKDVKDGPTNVLVEEEKTYEFIEEMIKTCRECYKSNLIHLGMDECWGLGLGQYMNKHGVPQDRAKLFNEHIKKVVAIARKYGFEPMIWGDMHFRLINPNGEYYSDRQLTPEIKAMIPQDVGLVYWDYYHDNKKIYDDMVKKYLELPNHTLFAGGSWNWASFAPLIKLSMQRTKLALSSMVEHHVKDVFMTTWGDSGAECSNFTALPTLATFSIFDYLGQYDEEALKSMLYAVTGEKLANMFLLDLPNEPEKFDTLKETNCGRFYLYQDPLLGLFDRTVKPSFKDTYASYLPLVKKAQEESKHFGYIYQNTYDLLDLLKDKVDLGVRIRNAYKSKNLDELKVIKEEVIPQVIKELGEFKESFRNRWYQENKNFGYEVMDGRFGFLKNRLMTTIELLDKYLSKEIPQIDELEEDILPYSKDIKDEDLWAWKWDLIVSPSEL